MLAKVLSASRYFLAFILVTSSGLPHYNMRWRGDLFYLVPHSNLISANCIAYKSVDQLAKCKRHVV